MVTSSNGGDTTEDVDPVAISDDLPVVECVCCCEL